MSPERGNDFSSGPYTWDETTLARQDVLARPDMPPVPEGQQNSQPVTSAETARPQTPEQIMRSHTDKKKCLGAVSAALFFPVEEESKEERREREERAKAVCKSCVLIEPCLEEALRLPTDAQHGVQGGTTQNERKKIRRERRNAAKEAASAQQE